MAKEPKEEKGEKGESKGKGKRHHLHEIRSTQAHDGSIIHHHSYKTHKDDAYTMPERGPMATSATPDEAGQHVAEMFGQNQMGGEEAAGGAPAGAAPEGAAGPGTAPQEEPEQA